MNFKKLNNDLYYKSLHYKFMKKPTDFDKGYMKISDWVNNLCWHYVAKRKQLDKDMDTEFKNLLNTQREKILALPPSEHKDGLMKAMNDVI